MEQAFSLVSFSMGSEAGIIFGCARGSLSIRDISSRGWIIHVLYIQQKNGEP